MPRPINKLEEKNGGKQLKTTKQSKKNFLYLKKYYYVDWRSGWVVKFSSSEGKTEAYINIGGKVEIMAKHKKK